MLKLIQLSNFDNWVKYAVNFPVVMKHLDVSDEMDVVRYLANLTPLVIGRAMADSLNVYGASFVAEESGADCYTRGEHGVVLVDLYYEQLFEELEIIDLTLMPEAPKEPKY